MIRSSLAAALLSTSILACSTDDTSDDDVGDTTGDTTTGDTTGDTTTVDDTTTTETTDETTVGDTTDTADTTDTTDTTDATDTTDTTDTEGALSFEADVYPIIAANCSCHVAGAPALLAMPDAATAYDNLVDVLSSQGGGLDRIEPGDPDMSHLYKKITGTQTTGAPMPFGNPALPAQTIATIEAWIADGAAP